MRSQWITSWILWLGQRKTAYAILMASIAVVFLGVLTWLVVSQPLNVEFVFGEETRLVLLSILVMSVLAIKLLDSLKTALLLFMVMLFLHVITSSLFLLLGLAENEFNVFARVVIVTIMMSHLIHFLTALLREMARGIHQYDAIIEALAITHQPILLSSLTTILGFVMVALFNATFTEMAYQIIIGVGLSYISLLVLVPTILLNWLLEFRVGHYNDRHGLDFVLKFIKKHPPWVLFSQILTFLMVVFMLWQVVAVLNSTNTLVGMLLVSFLLLLVVWKKVVPAIIAVFIALVAVLFAVVSLNLFSFVTEITALVLLVPIGIVLDDVVHFFARYVRAEQSFVTLSSEKIKFSINSVGRSIWLTSQLLVAGLAVLLFSNNQMVVETSLVTVFALIFVSFILLWILPVVTNNKIKLLE